MIKSFTIICLLGFLTSCAGGKWVWDKDFDPTPIKNNHEFFHR